MSGAPSGRLRNRDVRVCVGNRIFGPTLRLRTVKKFEQSKRLQKFEGRTGQGRKRNEREGGAKYFRNRAAMSVSSEGDVFRGCAAATLLPPAKQHRYFLENGFYAPPLFRVDSIIPS